MKISVIGTGRMGKGIVKTLSPYVETLCWASRNTEHVKNLIGGYEWKNHLLPVTYVDALEADMIIPALWFRDLLPWAKENHDKLTGKILIDIVNPFTEDFSDFTLDWGQSAAEELQRILPATKVVGAFKNTFFQVFNEPIYNELKSDVYVTSDDEVAKKEVMSLLESIPFRVIDGGNLSNNRIIERITLFEREVAIRYGNYPYISNHLFGINI
ncbi:MAG: NAD(P)-binding domain-containing protein [Bacillota bacterium]|nr:NAD(P)-binding domain-containing protein [Bacillota bacterium]